MRFLFFIAVSCMCLACGTSALIDYEKGVDWSSQKSYQYYSEMNSGLDELDEARVQKNIDSLLQSKGFQKEENNHYYVSYFVEEIVGEPINTVGVGVGSGGFGGSVGVPVGANQILQRLTIEIRDATLDQKLLWQAIHEGRYRQKANPNRKDEYYAKAIAEILETFPPQE